MLKKSDFKDFIFKATLRSWSTRSNYKYDDRYNGRVILLLHLYISFLMFLSTKRNNHRNRLFRIKLEKLSWIFISAFQWVMDFKYLVLKTVDIYSQFCRKFYNNLLKRKGNKMQLIFEEEFLAAILGGKLHIKTQWPDLKCCGKKIITKDCATKKPFRLNLQFKNWKAT